jgi:inhibitor of KinA sporulation pathway (predicted exonuclease)
MANRNKLHDKLVIIDLEATCDEPRPKWPSEIIEIGVCLLDLSTLNIEKPRGIMVKPVVSPVTPFCTKLTTITQEMLDREGITLAEAMRILEEEYKLDKRTWASWGDYDRKQFLKDCAHKGIGFPGESRTHLNLKSIIQVEKGLITEEGLDRACDRFHLKMEGTHHRGVDDARNIARIYQKHLQKVRSQEPERGEPGLEHLKGWDL